MTIQVPELPMTGSDLKSTLDGLRARQILSFDTRAGIAAAEGLVPGDLCRAPVGTYQVVAGTDLAADGSLVIALASGTAQAVRLPTSQMPHLAALPDDPRPAELFPEGAVLTTAEGARMEVLSPTETGPQLATAGGARLRPVAGQAITPEMFGARGQGAEDTSALVALAAFADTFADRLDLVRIDGTHRLTKTLQFTAPGLRITGAGRLIKGGPIATGSLSETDGFSSAALVTLAGAGQHLSGLTLTDEDGIDGATNGYGRALAVCASDVTVEGVTCVDWVNGIEVAWSDTGFVAGAENWSGTELSGARITGCRVTCRPHHDDQTSEGCGIRSFGSDNRITGNRVTADEAHGPGLRLLHGIKVEALSARRPGTPALDDSLGVVSGNCVTGPFRHNLYVEGLAGGTVTGNTCRRSGRDGMVVAGAEITVADNVVDAGGYRDSNDAYGIRVQSGKALSLTGNVIRPWRNVSGLRDGHHGLFLGRGVGHSRVSGNIFTRDGGVRAVYAVSAESGTLGTGAIQGAGGDRFEAVPERPAPGTILLGQGSGWFEPGEVLTQEGSDWTATVTARDDAPDARMDRGIECRGIGLTLEDNRFERGACATCVQARYASGLTLRGGVMEGFAIRGVQIQDMNPNGAGGPRDILIEGVTFRDAQDGTEEGVFVFSFDNLPERLRIRGCSFERLSRAVKFGGLDFGAMHVSLEGCAFHGNGADILNPRLGDVLYEACPGLKLTAQGEAVLGTGQQSVSVTHGLMGTPEVVLVTPGGDAGAVWADAPGTSSVTLRAAAPPAEDVPLRWRAEVARPGWA
ncbi:right-handed parallel beta-helix repeat-containing protein [Histidinibacterium aquaticum]|uniref:Uncharacterized protein n=1 Tax=Histidinibacterium aquaticum TaxID=2613962 RepID=A0A5J5GHX9_9RHOB|nr:right-handed parallel beta-helix repeat-containing protein [Histidinibacterium aquaticum]KAA9007836.1 hypothetical protein F3S47_09930 [Histidinibacterium aquaticum]